MGTAVQTLTLSTMILVLTGVGGCASRTHVELDSTFPVPLLKKTPVNLGIYLDDNLREYSHTETIEKKGEWRVDIGSAQESLFTNLGSGVFEAYKLVDAVQAPGMDGVLHPSIAEVQFSLPEQTRSHFYEVWIRYQFRLYDPAGNLVGEWALPAYGKASNRDFGSSEAGLRSAALAACRDAMAFFSINFAREPVVHQWLSAGKPLVPNNIPAPATAPAGASGDSEGDNA